MLESPEGQIRKSNSVPFFCEDYSIIEDKYDQCILDNEFQKVYGDFLAVGPDKMIASMPIAYIQEKNNYGFFLMEHHASVNNLKTKVVKNCFSLRHNRKSNGLYMYDRGNLQKYLTLHSDILTKYAVPKNAEEFIEWIGQNVAYYNEMPEVARLIAACYNKPLEERVS